MRLTFKLLLFPFLLFVGIYAATPLWLPHVLARQLPPGWQLEFLDTGYPGITGIGIKALRATGELQGSGIAISASKIRFSYRDLRTDIDSLAVDVKMGAGEKQPAEDFQLDDISLPVTRLTGKLPQLSIDHLLLFLHHVTDLASGNTVPAKPLEIHVGAFELTPRSAGNFHLAANVELYEFPLVRGRFELETAADSINAGTWFQSGTETLPWLAIQLEQRHLEGTATTQIKTVFDTELADPTTLDSILQRSTGNVIRHVDGKLEMEITFAGRDLQRPERLSVVTQKLRAESNRGTLGLEAGLLASREGDNILVTTTNAATFRFQDKTGWIDELIKIATPGVVRTTPPDTNLSLELDSNSSLLFRTATNPSIIFGGDIKLHLSSIDNRFSIHATELQIEADNTLDLETTTANGMITVDWEERVH